MRKFLLILLCAFSFCLRAETNTVQLTQDQWSYIRLLCDLMVLDPWYYTYIHTYSNGYLGEYEDNGVFPDTALANQYGLQSIAKLLHLIFTGTTTDSYDTSSNNVLAYASSLREHNDNMYSKLDDIYTSLFDAPEDEDLYTLLSGLQLDTYNTYSFLSYRFWNSFQELKNGIMLNNGFVTNQLEFIYSAITNRDFQVSLYSSITNIYSAITNLNFQVSISNQIEIFQEMSRGFGGVSNSVISLNDNIEGRFVALDLEQQIRHNELMDLLRGFTNGAFFASNLCNCVANSNYQDSVISMLDWMTNNFPDSVESPPIGGGGGSNDVWSVWRPYGPASGWLHLFVPTVEWVQDGNDSQQFKPLYGRNQYDSVYNGVWDQYASLLQSYRASGIDGQQFLAGLVDLQLHILANMSTQLYMIDSKMPSKTNMWDNINDEVNWVLDNAASTKSEVESKQYDVQSLFDNADTSMLITYFPKIQSSISKLNTTSKDPVLRLPLPSVFSSGSGSDVWVVDVREISGYEKLRDFVRWVCIIVWSIIFVRTFIVPSLVILCLCARFADMACGLLFTDNTDGCHVLGDVIGSCSDFVLNLIGLDTNVKRWAVGSS